MELWYIIGSMIAGSILSLVSVFAGAWLVSRSGNGTSPFVSQKEPEGEVFRIQDHGSPFPDDTEEKKGTSEEQVLNRTNQFLEMFNGSK